MEDSLSIARRVQKAEAAKKADPNSSEGDGLTEGDYGITKRFDIEELAKFVSGMQEMEKASAKQKQENKERKQRIRAEKFSKRRVPPSAEPTTKKGKTDPNDNQSEH